MKTSDWWKANGLSLVKELVHFQGKRFSVSKAYYSDLSDEQIVEMFDRLSLVKELVMTDTQLIITCNRM